MAFVDAPIREIFVVDDDPTARESLATLLIEAGFRVTLFADGSSVVGEARARTPACIILDLHMPGGSGLDILVKLDARHYSAPILVVSGRSDIPGVVEAIKRGSTSARGAAGSGRSRSRGRRRRWAGTAGGP